jgi:hypothetical protein
MWRFHINKGYGHVAQVDECQSCKLEGGAASAPLTLY